VLLRIEIILFLVALLYSLYYIFDIFYGVYKSSQKKKNQRIEKRKQIFEKQQIQAEKAPAGNNTLSSNKKLTGWDLDKLREVVKRAQINKSRGYYDTARNLIVEGLTIDKDNKELNLELAEVYELEENYVNAQYIYQDMLKIHPDSVDLLKRLWNVFSLQLDLDNSVKAYTMAFEKKRDDTDIVDILADLYFELKNFKKCLKFTKLFLKDKPRDIEKIGMKGYCLEKSSLNQEAIECYEKILEIQPYNMEIKERIAALQS